MSPMPGAWAKGTLASRAVRIQPMAALAQVATRTGVHSSPGMAGKKAGFPVPAFRSTHRVLGLTKIM